MVVLKVDDNKYAKLGLGVLVSRVLPVAVVLFLTILGGMASLRTQLWLSILLFIIAVPMLYTMFKAINRFLACITLKNTFNVTVGKDEVTGKGAFKRPISFKKSETLSIIFDEPVDSYVASFTLRRPKFKFMGAARLVVYDFYLTEDSFKELKKLISYRWGGSVRTTQVKGKDVLAWRDEK